MSYGSDDSGHDLAGLERRVAALERRMEEIAHGAGQSAELDARLDALEGRLEDLLRLERRVDELASERPWIHGTGEW